MCGRFYLDIPSESLLDHFGLPEGMLLTPRYNIAPSQEVAAVRQDEGGRALIMLRWGLVPFWAKDEKIGYRMINARTETVAEKPAFRAAFRHRRCLIPASGFYEWKTEQGGKRPYAIHLKNTKLFSFAGLWEHWEGAGRVVESCTILVTEANQRLKPIHDRMPVILHPDNYDSWLDSANPHPEELIPLLQPCPAEQISAYPVSRMVNSPGNDGPECIVPLDSA